MYDFKIYVKQPTCFFFIFCFFYQMFVHNRGFSDEAHSLTDILECHIQYMCYLECCYSMCLLRYLVVASCLLRCFVLACCYTSGCSERFLWYFYAVVEVFWAVFSLIVHCWVVWVVTMMLLKCFEWLLACYVLFGLSSFNVSLWVFKASFCLWWVQNITLFSLDYFISKQLFTHVHQLTLPMVFTPLKMQK